MERVETRREPGVRRPLSQSALDQFLSEHRGRVVQPGEDGYDQARTIWNAMMDRKPALIAQAQDAEDIRLSVNFCRENQVLLAVRGGGHGIAGNAICDDGLVIDLTRMKKIDVDPVKRRANVQPGATLADFDREAQKFGLATPLGINSTTGVAGLTLGGGFGWLTRKFGLTIDNLMSVDIVTADGRLLHANPMTNADLFWAVRGGGGNFGVVTNFEYRLHPVGPELFSGLMFFPFSEIQSILRQYREFAEHMPDELNVWAVLRKAPPLPFLPQDVHGKPVVALAMLYAGDPNVGRKLIEPLRSFAPVIGENVGVQPYTAWQSVFDPLLTPGARNYWKSHNFKKVSGELIDLLQKFVSDLPTDQSEIFLGAMGGEASRVPPSSCAYSHRDVKFVINVHGRWLTPAEDAKGMAWARDFYKATAPYATGGVYVNFLSMDDNNRIRSAYGENFERLAEIKAKYDPTNLFRMNQNIPPQAMTH